MSRTSPSSPAVLISSAVAASATTGELDIADAGVSELPPAVLAALRTAHKLNAAGNRLSALPPDFEARRLAALAEAESISCFECFGGASLSVRAL